MHQRASLGRTGEDIAARLLARKGYELLDRNFRDGRNGELDLVARRGDLVVFCEVKTRRSERWGSPAEAVDREKQRRLRRLAAAWFGTRGGLAGQVRFDVVSVIVDPSGTRVTHFENAF